MADRCCPVCYGPLEVRAVTPCHICGGWPESVENFDAGAEFREWRLPNESRIVLCRACVWEEFMVPGGWGKRLGLASGRHPIDELRPLPTSLASEIARDKFCPQCNLRLTFLKIVASRHE